MKRSQHAENKAQPAKKTKLSDQQGSSGESPDGAARRFFKIPELVHMVTPWLAKDRVDLLQLAATCKSFRVHALQTWATYLDVPLSMADKRLKLFQANPGLSRHVRYLRFYDDIVDYAFRGERHPQDVDHNRLWTEFAALLALIATEPPPGVQPPFLDLSIGCDDIERLTSALRPQSQIKLLRKMVALQVLECLPHFARRIYFPGFVLPMSSSNALIDLIGHAQQAATVSNSPGLRLFGYHSNPTHNIAFAPHAFWTAFSNATSQTLQELFIDSYHSFEGTFLSGISFPDLKRCELKIPGHDLHGAIQNFLSRHLTLEHLCITQTRGYLHPTHISLPQTLPSLRSLTLRKTIIGSSTALRDFTVRHPHLERLKVSDKHSSFSSGEGRLGDSSYHLAQILKSQSSPDPRFFDEVASQGGSVAHIELLEADSKSTSTLGEFMSSSWLNKAQNAQAARAVTCLELVFSNRASSPTWSTLTRPLNHRGCRVSLSSTFRGARQSSKKSTSAPC
ncbi:hypothetical protein CF326_g897 [Tilletia indica]|nr:hypothetical protein CF326_g897 [Tilletia indica]